MAAIAVKAQPPADLIPLWETEYVRLAREAFGAFNAMMAHLSPQERESVWNEVEGSAG